MAHQRKIGALLSYTLSAVQIIVNLLYVPLLLQTVGSAEYGLFQMIGSIIAYMNVITSTLSAGATRYYSKFLVLNDKQGMVNTIGILKRIYRWANVIITVATILAGVAIRIAYAQSFTEWEMTESLLILSLLAINMMVSLNNTISISVIVANEKFIFYKASTIVMTVLQPLLVVLGVLFFPYALTVSIMQLLSNTLIRVWQHWYAVKRLGMTSEGFTHDPMLQKGILTFSSSIILAAIADQIFWKTDQLVLGYFYGPQTVAAYSVGSQIVNSYMPLGLAITSIFLPKISQLWHKEHDLHSISLLFTQVSRITLYPLLLVLTGFIAFGQSFIQLWAGPEYAVAYWVAVIELAPFTIDLMQSIGLTILQVMNKYSFRAYAYFAAALINIILTVLLVQKYSSVGAAIASGVTILVCSGFVVNWYFSRKVHLEMWYFWRNIIPEVIPLLIWCAIGTYAWSQKPFAISWPTLLAGISLYTIGYAIICFYLCMNHFEKVQVKRILNHITQMR